MECVFTVADELTLAEQNAWVSQLMIHVGVILGGINNNQHRRKFAIKLAEKCSLTLKLRMLLNAI